nr:YrdB family protein [Microbacterium endophyticum]
MSARPSVIDILAFIVELAAFAVLAVWGFLAWPFAWNILFGIATPAIAILVWALFVSPRAVLAVHPFVRAFAELLIYAAATIVLWSLGLAWAGIAFAVIAVTVGVLAGRRRLA